MTSVPFNIGLDSERRSSRVLMPPGGKNSDIFGTATAEPPASSRRRNICGRPDSNIMNIPEENQSGGSAPAPQENEKTEQKPDAQTAASETSFASANGQGDANPVSEVKKDITPPTVGKGDENRIDSKKDDKPSQPQTDGKPIPRGRIPPGGYSTKLW